MSKQNYPAVTKNFGDSFGESPSKQPRTFTEHLLGYDNSLIEENLDMSHTATKPNRTELLEEALASATPKPSRSTHLKLLTEHEWHLIHDARRNGSRAGLAQLFLSMQRAYQDNNEPFFATYPQFYNAYRQAAKVYNLAPIKPRKAKPE